MLVPKLRHGFALALCGVIFVSQLASCESSNGEIPGGLSGASFTTAGQAPVGSAGAPPIGSGGAPAIAGASASGAPGVAGSFASGGVAESGGSAGTAGAAQPCDNKQHPDHVGESCDIWPDWDLQKEANEPKDCDAQWLTGVGYCRESCGKCSSGTGGGGGGSAGGFSTGLGPGPTLPTVNSTRVMWASRYWDCCKPHCSTNGNIKSCGSDGVSQNGGGSACSGGSAYACYSQAPRYLGDNVSYGYVAVPNPSCGTCYHLQFTGTGQHNKNDPGSKAIAGKHMIVKVTNTGGDVAGNQFDLMIPGGGTGLNPNTCPNQWKLSAADLAPTSGGFLTSCTGTYAAKKECVRAKCMKLPEGDVRKGCFWFVDWYAAADNPNFVYDSYPCPSDI